MSLSQIRVNATSRQTQQTPRSPLKTAPAGRTDYRNKIDVHMTRNRGVELTLAALNAL
jgi:hypothetical protein